MVDTFAEQDCNMVDMGALKRHRVEEGIAVDAETLDTLPVAADPSLARRIAADGCVVVVAFASVELVMVVLTRMTTMPRMPKPLISSMIPSFAMVSNQHLQEMPKKDFPIPPREVYCCRVVVEAVPNSTEEENFDGASSRPVAALESSSFVVEDTETCCTADYVENGELRWQW